MNRKSWDELLFLYLTGVISSEDRADFEHYLAANEKYRAELDEWRKLADAVRTKSDSRVGQLPALTPAFYQRLQAQSKHSLNGSHSAQPKERKIMNITQVATFEHPQKPKTSRSITLAAALLAVIVFTGALLFANGRRPDEDSFLSGVQVQRETSTPSPAATATRVDEQLDPLYITATAIILDATRFAAESATPLATMPPTFTPTPLHSGQTSLFATLETPVPIDIAATPTMVPFDTQPFTATPIPWSGDSTVLPPTVPPLASITPSQIDPIISSPAQVVKEIRLPTGDASRALAWSPDGKTIAVAGYQGTWLYTADHIDGAARLFPDNGPGVLEVAFSADSSLLATLNSAQTLRIWDVESGVQLAEMAESPLWDDLQFSPDGRYLISRNSDQKISLAGLQEGILEAEPLTSANLNGYYALLNPDGKILAAYKGGSVLLLDFETSNASGNFDWPSAGVSQAAYSRDGLRLALGGDKEVIVVDATGGGYQNSMSVLGMVTGMSFNDDGTMLAASMRSDKIQSLWLMNMIPGNTFYTAIFVYDLPLVNPVFSPNSNQLAVATEDGRLFILEVTQ